jgi:hypothetical protein
VLAYTLRVGKGLLKTGDWVVNKPVAQESTPSSESSCLRPLPRLLRMLVKSHSLTVFNRRALSTTVNDESAIAAPASIGESRIPATG